MTERERASEPTPALLPSDSLTATGGARRSPVKRHCFRPRAPVRKSRAKALGRLYTAAEVREGGRGVMEEKRKQGGVLEHEKNKATTDAIYHYTGVSPLQL